MKYETKDKIMKAVVIFAVLFCLAGSFYYGLEMQKETARMADGVLFLFYSVLTFVNGFNALRMFFDVF